MAQRGPGPVVVLVMGFTLITIAAGTIIARLHLRLKMQRRKLLVSDMLICAAWVSGLATTCLDVVFMRLGALDSAVLFTMENFRGGPDAVSEVLKTLWLMQIPFWAACLLSKAALLSMYLQVFPVFMRRRRIFLWAIIIYTTLSYVVSFIMLFSICRPMSTYWNLNSHSTCPTARANLIFYVPWPIQFMSNLLIFGLPWLIIPELHMRRILKIGMYCTFLLGLVTIVFDLLRFAAIQASIRRGSVPISTVLLWVNMDCNISIIVACLPTLRPYLRKQNAGSREMSGPSALGRSMTGYGNEATSSRKVRNGASHSDRLEEEIWGDVRKSNASDVDLVQAKPRAEEIN
ncbi:hypothetical protein EDB80DRAFT_614529 [Ilyonectria destructans]|nr:hypothetical protein EDB80DRAFT_614529 [Ilyonectria destructans]